MTAPPNGASEEAFPPPTSVNEYPLHGWDYGDDYACQRPEDPACLTYDWRCPLCLIAAKASLHSRGDYNVTWRRNANAPEQQVTLSWLIARADHWRDRNTEQEGPFNV